jgi:hypothetical protein
MSNIRSFGYGQLDEPSTDEDLVQPTPVLHVGEVHAELRLTITADTLHDLGSQIASMLASATKQGFEEGLAAAMGEAGDEQLDVLNRGGPIPSARPFTDDDLRRAHGE